MRELLAVQAIDTAIDQATYALEHSPTRDKISGLQGSMKQGDSARSQVQAALDAIRKEQRRFEDEAALVEDKATSIGDQLYGGGKSVRELEALQADLASLKRRQGDLEDRALEQMEAAEPVQAQLDAVDAKLRELGEELDSATQALIVEEAEIEARLGELHAAKAEAVVPIAAEVLARYDKLRSQLGGVAVAELVGARCEGCHLSLSAVDLDQIRKLPEGSPATCPECSRLLVRRAMLA